MRSSASCRLVSRRWSRSRAANAAERPGRASRRRTIPAAMPRSRTALVGPRRTTRSSLVEDDRMELVVDLCVHHETGVVQCVHDVAARRSPRPAVRPVSACAGPCRPAAARGGLGGPSSAIASSASGCRSFRYVARSSASKRRMGGVGGWSRRRVPEGARPALLDPPEQPLAIAAVVGQTPPDGHQGPGVAADVGPRVTRTDGGVRPLEDVSAEGDQAIGFVEPANGHAELGLCA